MKKVKKIVISMCTFFILCIITGCQQNLSDTQLKKQIAAELQQSTENVVIINRNKASENENVSFSIRVEEADYYSDTFYDAKIVKDKNWRIASMEQLRTEYTPKEPITEENMIDLTRNWLNNEDGLERFYTNIDLLSTDMQENTFIVQVSYSNDLVSETSEYKVGFIFDVASDGSSNVSWKVDWIYNNGIVRTFNLDGVWYPVEAEKGYQSIEITGGNFTEERNQSCGQSYGKVICLPSESVNDDKYDNGMRVKVNYSENSAMLYKVSSSHDTNMVKGIGFSKDSANSSYTYFDGTSSLSIDLENGKLYWYGGISLIGHLIELSR